MTLQLMKLPFRASTYALIAGGMLLTLLMGSNTSKSHDHTMILGAVALLFIWTMGSITCIAMLRQISPRLCVVNVILLVLFSGLLSAGYVHKQQFSREHRMKMRIIDLERALQAREVPINSSDVSR